MSLKKVGEGLVVELEGALTRAFVDWQGYRRSATVYSTRVCTGRRSDDRVRRMELCSPKGLLYRKEVKIRMTTWGQLKTDLQI